MSTLIHGYKIGDRVALNSSWSKYKRNLGDPYSGAKGTIIEVITPRFVRVKWDDPGIMESEVSHWDISWFREELWKQSKDKM